jgi:hypothetical protein
LTYVPRSTVGQIGSNCPCWGMVINQFIEICIHPSRYPLW